MLSGVYSNWVACAVRRLGQLDSAWLCSCRTSSNGGLATPAARDADANVARGCHGAHGARAGASALCRSAHLPGPHGFDGFHGHDEVCAAAATLGGLRVPAGWPAATPSATRAPRRAPAANGLRPWPRDAGDAGHAGHAGPPGHAQSSPTPLSAAVGWQR